MHKLMLNLCLCEQSLRDFFLNVLSSLLHNDQQSVLALLEKLTSNVTSPPGLPFPPSSLIGMPPSLFFISLVPLLSKSYLQIFNFLKGSSTDVMEESSLRQNVGTFKRRQIVNSAITVAASLPATARGSSTSDGMIPPIVSRRIISCLSSLCKASPRVAFSMLLQTEDAVSLSCLEKVRIHAIR